MTLAAQSIASQAPDLSVARRAMIDSQLRVSGINQDWLLDRFAQVLREDHLPASARAHAYIDRAIPVSKDAAIPAPLVQAMLLAEAAPQASDTVLVISPSSYLAALVEPLVQSVETASAAQAIARQSMTKVSLILIDGAVETVPKGLVDALQDGGRIVAGLVLRKVTRLAVGRKINGTVELVPLAEIGIPVLAEFAAPKSWSF